MLRSGAHAGLVSKDLGLLNGHPRQELVAAGLHKLLTSIFMLRWHNCRRGKEGAEPGHEALCLARSPQSVPQKSPNPPCLRDQQSQPQALRLVSYKGTRLFQTLCHYQVILRSPTPYHRSARVTDTRHAPTFLCGFHTS